MKLIVAGSTGSIATEVIRQALSNPAITSIIALARRTTDVPPNAGPDADTAKLKSVVCEDFENYPKSVKQDLSYAHACIWLVGVTVSKQSAMPFPEVRKICLDYTVTGLSTIAQLPHPLNIDGKPKPFRFIYTSGAKAERDQARKPWLLGDYILMRGEVESVLLSYAAESGGAVEMCITKPGLIDSPEKRQTRGLPGNVMGTVGRFIIGLPTAEMSEVAAALIDQAVGGFEKDTLLNEDLVRIGRKSLAKQGTIPA